MNKYIKSKISLVRLYQKIIFDTFARMKSGHLKIINFDGQVFNFGSPHIGSDEIRAEIRILSPQFFKRCIWYGDIGFGESFTAGEWVTDCITDVIRWMILNFENNPSMSGSNNRSLLIGLLRSLNHLQHLFRKNTYGGSRRNISEHYDLGNRFFETFLDSSMTYSCADFSQGAKSLEDAQIAKFDRLAKAIDIKPSDHVLEVGGGWGAFAIHLVKKYGVKVTTITISRRQFDFVRQKIRQLNLQDKIELRMIDYRKIDGLYDKIVSVEMLEAVGHSYLPLFFEMAERCLKPHGVMGVQVILCADSRYPQLRKNVDWTQKYIFPGSLLPSIGALTDASRKSSRLQLFSLHDLGDQYGATLSEWRYRFNSHLDKIYSLGFEAEFIRIWNYYLSYCEAAFRMRHISVAQLVYTRPNNTNFFDAPTPLMQQCLMEETSHLSHYEIETEHSKLAQE